MSISIKPGSQLHKIITELVDVLQQMERVANPVPRAGEETQHSAGEGRPDRFYSDFARRFEDGAQDAFAGSILERSGGGRYSAGLPQSSSPAGSVGLSRSGDSSGGSSARSSDYSRTRESGGAAAAPSTSRSTLKQLIQARREACEALLKQKWDMPLPAFGRNAVSKDQGMVLLRTILGQIFSTLSEGPEGQPIPYDANCPMVSANLLMVLAYTVELIEPILGDAGSLSEHFENLPDYFGTWLAEDQDDLDNFYLALHDGVQYPLMVARTVVANNREPGYETVLDILKGVPNTHTLIAGGTSLSPQPLTVESLTSPSAVSALDFGAPFRPLGTTEREAKMTHDPDAARSLLERVGALCDRLTEALGTNGPFELPRIVQRETNGAIIPGVGGVDFSAQLLELYKAAVARTADYQSLTQAQGCFCGLLATLASVDASNDPDLLAVDTAAVDQPEDPGAAVKLATDGATDGSTSDSSSTASDVSSSSYSSSSESDGESQSVQHQEYADLLRRVVSFTSNKYNQLDFQRAFNRVPKRVEGVDVHTYREHFAQDIIAAVGRLQDPKHKVIYLAWFAERDQFFRHRNKAHRLFGAAVNATKGVVGKNWSVVLEKVNHLLDADADADVKLSRVMHFSGSHSRRLLITEYNRVVTEEIRVGAEDGEDAGAGAAAERSSRASAR